MVGPSTQTLQPSAQFWKLSFSRPLARPSGWLPWADHWTPGTSTGFNPDLCTWPSKPCTTRPHCFLQPRSCLVPRKTGWKRSRFAVSQKLLGLSAIPGSFWRRRQAGVSPPVHPGRHTQTPVLLILKSSSLPGPGRLPCWNRMRSYLSQCNLPCGFGKCSTVSRHSSVLHAPL